MKQGDEKEMVVRYFSFTYSKKLDKEYSILVAPKSKDIVYEEVTAIIAPLLANLKQGDENKTRGDDFLL